MLCCPNGWCRLAHLFPYACALACITSICLLAPFHHWYISHNCGCIVWWLSIKLLHFQSAAWVTVQCLQSKWENCVNFYSKQGTGGCDCLQIRVYHSSIEALILWDADGYRLLRESGWLILEILVFCCCSVVQFPWPTQSWCTCISMSETTLTWSTRYFEKWLYTKNLVADKHVFLFSSFLQSTDRKGAWSEMAKGGGLLKPGADRHGGSVQVVSSTNGELGPSDVSRVEGRSGVPLNTAPEVEVVEETK